MIKKNLRRGICIGLSMTILAGMLAGCGAASQRTSDGASAEYHDEMTSETNEPEGDYEEAAEAVPKEGAGQDNEMYEDSTDAYDDLYDWNDEAASDEALQNSSKYSGSDEEYNAEEYEKEDENGFCIVKSQPLSTFSADVDTASYANVRRMIEDGYTLDMIDPEAVRPEEFINYFSYNLNKPKKGEMFGVTTEVSTCPWNKEHELMFVGMATEPVDMSKAPDTNLVFLLDVSGSMDEPDKLPLLQQSFKELVSELGKNDTVSIVTYADGVETVLAGANGTQKEKIYRALDGLYAGGGTNGEDGIQKAYELVKANYIKGGNNRVILATDGDLNIGISDPDELEKFIAKKKESGIYLSVLGFGTGNIKDNNMERLADCGNGNYSYIDSLFEAKKVLVEEMGANLLTIAEDVKLQVEFNPEKVNSYRLIGYENRRLTDRDFYDDKKDAGEIGAGHQVIALYEIIPAGAADEIKLKYQDGEAHTDLLYNDEYATVAIRYKAPGKSESRQVSYVVDFGAFTKYPSDDFVFASLVAEFALILSDSDYKGDADYQYILDTYKTLDINDEYKDEFYYLVKQMAKRDNMEFFAK